MVERKLSMKVPERIANSLWFRPAAYALGAITIVFICWIGQGIPIAVGRIERHLVSTLLMIITTSMLTVTVFTVGSMLTAFAAATSSGTPRAFRLIVADGSSQRAAGSFIGAFIFGLVATIAIESEVFDPDGYVLLFLVTVAILVWVIATFIGWIDQIARLGQIDTSIHKSEVAAARALAKIMAAPHLGGTRQDSAVDYESATPLHPTQFGYLTKVDMKTLQNIAEQHELTITLSGRPGIMIDPNIPVAHAIAADDGQIEPDVVEKLKSAFDVADERDFETDPGFSLRVLAEIAAKALSPGVNDPGTALTVINAVTRRIGNVGAIGTTDIDPEYPRVHVPDLRVDRLVHAGFDPIVRYGVADADVVLHLVAAFRYLAYRAGEPSSVQIEEYARNVLTAARTHMMSHELKTIAAMAPPEWLDDLS